MRFWLPVALAAALCACSPGTSPSPTPSGASPAPGASPSSAAGGANHFIVNGSPAPNSGAATITAFSSGQLSCNFGLAVGVIPSKYLLTVDMTIKDNVGSQPGYGTANISKAIARLGVDSVAYAEGAVWTPEKPAGTTFDLAVKDRHVTLKWVGSVKAADGTPYQIDALMTDVAVPFK